MFVLIIKTIGRLTRLVARTRPSARRKCIGLPRSKVMLIKKKYTNDTLEVTYGGGQSSPARCQYRTDSVDC